MLARGTRPFGLGNIQEQLWEAMLMEMYELPHPVVFALIGATFPLSRLKREEKGERKWVDARETFLINNFCGRQGVGLI